MGTDLRGVVRREKVSCVDILKRRDERCERYPEFFSFSQGLFSASPLKNSLLPCSIAIWDIISSTGHMCCFLGQDTLLSQCLHKWKSSGLVLGSITSRCSGNEPALTPKRRLDAWICHCRFPPIRRSPAQIEQA